MSEVSVDHKLIKIKNYYAKMGWTKEFVFLNELIVKIEGTADGAEFIKLLNKPSTIKAKRFFDKFWRIAVNNKGEFDSLYLDNAFAAFDSANSK